MRGTPTPRAAVLAARRYVGALAMLGLAVGAFAYLHFTDSLGEDDVWILPTLFCLVAIQDAFVARLEMKGASRWLASAGMSALLAALAIAADNDLFVGVAAVAMANGLFGAAYHLNRGNP